MRRKDLGNMAFQKREYVRTSNRGHASKSSTPKPWNANMLHVFLQKIRTFSDHVLTNLFLLHLWRHCALRNLWQDVPSDVFKEQALEYYAGALLGNVPEKHKIYSNRSGLRWAEIVWGPSNSLETLNVSISNQMMFLFFLVSEKQPLTIYQSINISFFFLNMFAWEKTIFNKALTKCRITVSLSRRFQRVPGSACLFQLGKYTEALKEATEAIKLNRAWSGQLSGAQRWRLVGGWGVKSFIGLICCFLGRGIYSI